MLHTHYTTTGMRMTRLPPGAVRPPRRPPQDPTLKAWFAARSRQHARTRLAAIAPTAEKLARRSLAGLRAALSILRAPSVELRDVRAALVRMRDTLLMGNVRLGYLDEEAVWEDARAAMASAEIAAELGTVTERTLRTLGTCLAVAEALLSVPEAERAAALGLEAA